MEYRQLGSAGLKVSALALGTATFGGVGQFFEAWGRTDLDQARRLLAMAQEAGVNLIDCADSYSRGTAEEILGHAIAGTRSQWLIATKARDRPSIMLPASPKRTDARARHGCRKLKTRKPRVTKARTRISGNSSDSPRIPAATPNHANATRETPPAKPSRPSIMLTAFTIPTTTKIVTGAAH